MTKYTQSDKLQELIDWESIMAFPRTSGGHIEQMTGLFKGATVIAFYHSGDYQGEVATCVRLPDGRFAIYNDYYGSCSGCDSWEDADDESVRLMCIQLANGAFVFESLEDVMEYLGTVTKEDNYDWGVRTGRNLLRAIAEEL